MSTPRISDEQYLTLVKTFREQIHSKGKPNYTAAAKAAKTSFPTAKKAYEKGFARDNREAIGDMVRRDKNAARAALAALSKKENEIAATTLDQALMDEAIQRQEEEAQAREHARAVKTDEGRIAHLSRQSALGALASAVQVNGMAASLVKTWVPYIKAGKHPVKRDPKGQPVDLSMTEALAFLREASRTGRASIGIARTSLEIERLLLGQPTDILGISPVNMTLEEAVAVQKSAAEAANLIEAKAQIASDLRAELQVYQGGKRTGTKK